MLRICHCKGSVCTDRRKYEVDAGSGSVNYHGQFRSLFYLSFSLLSKLRCSTPFLSLQTTLRLKKVTVTEQHLMLQRMNTNILQPRAQT